MKLVLAAILALVSIPCFSAVKIGLVDIQKILTSVKQGQSVMKKLEKRYNERKGEIKKEEDRIKAAQEEFKKQSTVLSESAKMTKERDIQQMIFKLQNQTLEYQKEINELEAKEKKPLIEKVQKIVMEVSKKAAVDMTFEVSSSPVVYAETRIDLTDDVIKEYDKQNK